MTELSAVEVSVVHRSRARGVPDFKAITDLNVTIRGGELTVLRGRSGSGKTTLLHTLGLIQAPTTGKVLLDGKSIADLPITKRDLARRAHFGYVFQSFGLIPALTARESIELPLRIRNMDPAERDARVDEMLELVGLTKHAEQRPSELSGGQQQRVGIARALAGRPDVLLADEPTGQLDARTAEEIMGLLREASDTGVAILVATHDLAMMGKADRVLELHAGVLTEKVAA
jgi:putative ABC transport system ATP-binding protein